MAKYQFKKKINEPSDETIRSKMDFNKLLKQQQVINSYKQATQPLYKKPLFLGFILLLAVLCLVLIMEDQASNEGNQKNQKDSTTLDSLQHSKK
jgi:hypothetical protein